MSEAIFVQGLTKAYTAKVPIGASSVSCSKLATKQKSR